MPSPASTAGQLWLAVIHPAIKRWLHDRGFVMGDFTNGRNLLDVIKDDAFQRELHQAMHGAAQLDREPVERLLKGFATLGGVKWTNELQQRARIVSGDIAQIAPQLHKLAPDVMDTLAGSRGSVATLTQAIAEAHRDRLSPAAAGDLAKQLHSRLTANDPHSLRGFTTGDLGALYKELRRQGRIGDAAHPDEIHKRLLDYAKPVSAVRDALGTADIHAALDTFRTLPSDIYHNASMDEVESRIRQGDILGRQGGAYAMSAQAHGLPPGTDLAQLAQRDAVLRQQAASSSVGNLVAATHRLGQTAGFAPGSHGANMLEAIHRGEIPTTSPGDWLQAMQSSGIDPATARAFLGHTAANRKAITPELVDTIRRNQGQIDLQPQVQQRLQMAGPASDLQIRSDLLPGAQEEIAARAGYQDWDEVQALHGAPAQGVRDMYAWGRQQGQRASQLSGIGAQGLGRRMVDAVQGATPQTTGMDLLRSGINVIPHSELPAMPKVGVEARGPKGEYCPHCDSRLEYNSDDQKCNHCGKSYPPEKLAVYDRAGVKELIEAAVAECRTPKSPEHADAGNYQKGHLHIYGLPITIETGKGMTRSGVAKDGTEWSQEMQHSYGYLKKSLSEADGDHIDVFLNDDDPIYEKVFIIDQVDPDSGDFDEHKCLCFFANADEAKDAYHANYEDGWQGFGGMTEMSLDEFKDWVENGDTSKPLSKLAAVLALVAA